VNDIIELKASTPLLGYKLLTFAGHRTVEWAHIFHGPTGWVIRTGKGEAQPIEQPVETARAWRDNGHTVSLWHCYGACMTAEIKAELLALTHAGASISSGMCQKCRDTFVNQAQKSS
jgi:hypothetical protein